MAATAGRMAAELVHRGPDAEGVWVDEAGGPALAHRRLSIVDLGPHAAQPMHSADGRFVLVYNGEIYNHRALAQELRRAGVAFRGYGDTEVLAAALACWGLQATLARLTGMFAFAAWDRQERRLLLARDRLGEKPLYYGWLGGAFVFASEVKALHAIGTDALRPDRDAILDCLGLGYVPGPASVWAGVRKLTPGTALMVGDPARTAEPQAYWQLPAPTARPPAGMDARAGEDDVIALLRDSVAGCLQADVPVGVFLSGGLDSSTVAVLAAGMASAPVHTYSAGFDFAAYDESASAAAVARHIGSVHHPLQVGTAEALALIPQLADIYDEPFADSSQIPSVLIARAARREVKVVLSGDGGDEVFGGYYRHRLAGRLQRLFARTPAGARRLLARALLAIGPAGWDRALRLAERALPAHRRPLPPGERVHKLARVLGSRDTAELYLGLVALGPAGVPAALAGRAATLEAAFDTTPAAAMMYLDTLTYLPDDILVKVDRAAMSASLEVRAPLLDHRVVSAAAALPIDSHLQGGTGKLLLRRLLAGAVPAELLARPKTGFAVPMGAWLRTELRDWAQDLLTDNAMAAEGLVDAGQVRALWAQHLAGQRDASQALWPVLMCEAWWRRWVA